MNQAQYELQMAARTQRYEARKLGRVGKESYLERKIAARRSYFAQKRVAEGRKQARIERGMRKMDSKAAKFSVRVARWNKGWDRMRARWEARTRRQI